MNTITIGRSSQCDIILSGENISRVHAELSLINGQYIYHDHSTNGSNIDGQMIHNRKIAVAPGTRILLANRISLPWDRVYSLLPMSGYRSNEAETRHQGNYVNEGNYRNDDNYRYDRQYDHYQQAYQPKSATGWLVAIYIFAFLGGLLGFAFGISVYVQKIDLSNGQTVHKYKESHRSAALIGAILSVISFLFWVAVNS